MIISSKGMDYYILLLDKGDSNISREKEYSLRECFDWIEENEDVKSIRELIDRRKGWLLSNEFKIFSGEFKENELKIVLKEFEDDLKELMSREYIEKGK